MSDVDRSRCAICGQPNGCAIEAAGGDLSAAASCWCVAERFAPETLARVPADLVDRTCICRRCVAAGAGELPAGVRMSEDPGGRTTVVLERGDERVAIATVGAQVLSWHRGDRDVLWTASAPRYEPAAPVRGGIPVVFPWFGDADAPGMPAHGFARTLAWQVESLSAAPGAVFAVRDDEHTRALWPHGFRAELAVTLRDGLELSMTVRNDGDEPFAFEQALHTYFAVGDVREASVHGLERVPFVETAAEPERGWDPSLPLRFRAETDRVFGPVPARLALRAPALGRAVTLQTDGAHSAIVWNPWAHKGARLSQMHADDWQRFCCVESANVREHAVRLEPGGRHRMTLRLTVGEEPSAG